MYGSTTTDYRGGGGGGGGGGSNNNNDEDDLYGGFNSSHFQTNRGGYDNSSQDVSMYNNYDSDLVDNYGSFSTGAGFGAYQPLRSSAGASSSSMMMMMMMPPQTGMATAMVPGINDDGLPARPMTSVRAAGYTSAGPAPGRQKLMFDPLQQGWDP